MEEEVKIRILAKFFAKVRHEGDPYLDRLFNLDVDWDKEYQKLRINLSFEAARILANEVIICKIMSFDYV